MKVLIILGALLLWGWSNLYSLEEGELVKGHILSPEATGEFDGQTYTLRKSKYTLGYSEDPRHSSWRIVHYYLCRENDSSVKVLAMFTLNEAAQVKMFSCKDFIAIVSSDGFFGSVTTYSVGIFRANDLEALSKLSLPWSNEYFADNRSSPNVLEKLSWHDWNRNLGLPYCGTRDDPIRRQAWSFESRNGKLLAHPINPRIKSLSDVESYIYDVEQGTFSPSLSDRGGTFLKDNSFQSEEKSPAENAISSSVAAEWFLPKPLIAAGLCCLCVFLFWLTIRSRRKKS